MNINNVGNLNNINKNYKADKSNNQHQSSPNFKGLLDIPGAFMNGIENGGFVASFLVQDTLGMTVPRSEEGLVRGVDKERVKATRRVLLSKLLFKKPKDEDKAKMLHLKDLNYKEGAEVFIREGLSGPFIMFTPMLVLLAGKKFVSKSSFTNSSLIKRVGKTMTDLVSSTKHDSVEALKNDFYRKNVSKMVKATTQCPNADAENAFIEKAVASMEKMDAYAEKMSGATPCRRRKISKLQEREQKKLLQSFNDFHKTYSTDYSLFNRVKLDGEVYSTDKAINGIRDYAYDVVKNKNIEDITSTYTDKVKKKSFISRVIVNAAAAVSTIASLSIIPMLYKLVNPVPPGALGDPHTADEKLKATQANETKPEVKSDKNNGKVSFTGRYDKFAKYFEFNGKQMTPALMLSLAGGGLLVPRVTTAAERAPKNPVTQKKDYSEIPEIITRDVVSTGAVTFGVPMLSKLLVSAYEHASGFVLQAKPDKPLKGVRKVLDMINPFSSFGPHVLKDLDQMYGNMDSHDKLKTFSSFVDENNGSLARIFKTEKNTKKVFEDYGLNIKELSKGDRKESNKKIIEKIADSEFAQKLLDAIKPEKAGKANKLLKRARSLNSMTTFAATIVFIPAFLGLLLPRMVYGMTAKRQKKLAEATRLAQEAQNKTAQAQPAQENKEDAVNKEQKVVSGIDYSKLNKSIAKSQTFTQMKHAS